MNDIETQLFNQLNEVEERKNWIHEEVMTTLELDRKTYLEILSFSSKQYKKNILVDYIINEKNKEVVDDLLSKGIIETYKGKRNKQLVRFTEYGIEVINNIQALSANLFNKYFGQLETRDKKDLSKLLGKFLG